MNRWPREFAAWLAALTGVVLILAVVSFLPKASKGIKVWTVNNYTHGTCDGWLKVIHVLPGKLELNGHAVTVAALESELRSAMSNRVERVAYVDGDPAAAFGEVAQVLSLLHSLNVHVAMLTPSVDRQECLGMSVPTPIAPSHSGLRQWMQPIPWWRFW